MDAIRRRALVALGLNRTPGFHFAGNFLGVEFGTINQDAAAVVVTPGQFCTGAGGEPHFGVVALLADIALATVVRANLTPAQRLGTVGLHLQLRGQRMRGTLRAESRFAGFLDGAAGRQGLSRVTLDAGGQPTVIGQGTFMVMRPPPGVTMHPIPSAIHAGARPLAEPQLDDTERATLSRVDAALTRAAASGGAFIDELWRVAARPTRGGAIATVDNGPELANRVGHVQGGLQAALAAATAAAALPADWMLTGVSAWYIRACEGRHLTITSRIVHQGRGTAVVRTRIVGKGRRQALEVVTTHVPREG
ncbi:MAG: PaaI family thioesterase [Gammaproteobacteria bacterium]